MPNFSHVQSQLTHCSSIAADDDMGVPQEWGAFLNVGGPRDLPAKSQVQSRDDSRNSVTSCVGINERLSDTEPNRVYWWSTRMKSLDRIDGEGKKLPGIDTDAPKDASNSSTTCVATRSSRMRCVGTPRGATAMRGGRGRGSSQARQNQSPTGRARCEDQKDCARQPRQSSREKALPAAQPPALKVAMEAQAVSKERSMYCL